MSNRWTRDQDDSTRLPEGFERIGYDADTRVYTFRDANGILYQGEPGARYGVLTPMPSATEVVERVRPSAFARSPLRSSTLPARVSVPKNLRNSYPSSEEKSPKTFQDFLPPELLTSSTLSEAAHAKNSNSGLSSSRISLSSGSNKAKPFVELVRKSTTSLRRSVTAIRGRKSRLRPQASAEGEDEKSKSLFRRRGSTLSKSSASGLDKSTSVSATKTEM